ncbi:MAG: hypothetical protein ACYC4B_29625 [Pirellulaceae bacterium]
MSKKRKSASQKGKETQVHTSLPPDLDQRLQVVWQQLGHLIDWCDTGAAWTKLFCSEPRPYWETFYWESIARMVFEYLSQHPTSPPEDALSDCLIATQCPPCADDRAALKEFHEMWAAIVSGSHDEIDAFMQLDLEFAKQIGNYALVAALYAADKQAWGRK